MIPDRKTSITVGILFVVATAAPITSLPFLRHLEASDRLIALVTHRSEVITGVFLELVMALAIAGIAVTIHPILRRHSETLALGYVTVRLIESVVFIAVTVMSLVSLISVAQEYAGAASPDATHFQTIAQLVVNAHDWSYVLAGKIIFSLSALILNVVLYRFKLVPRFISGWGLAGAMLLLAGGMLEMFGQLTGNAVFGAAAFLPIAAQEMVFALWLIGKGFNRPAIVEPPLLR